MGLLVYTLGCRALFDVSPILVVAKRGHLAGTCIHARNDVGL